MDMLDFTFKVGRYVSLVIVGVGVLQFIAAQRARDPEAKQDSFWAIGLGLAGITICTYLGGQGFPTL